MSADANGLGRACIAEFLGTFLLVFVGCGACAVSTLFNAHALIAVALLWGLGVVIAVHLTAGVSGAHLNPAVTLALVLWRKFPRGRALPYVLAQLAGAFAAAALLHGLFHGPLAATEAAAGFVRGQPGSEVTAAIFAEFFPNPAGQALTAARQPRVSEPLAAAAEVVGTAVLVFAIFGFTDERNRARPSPSLVPLCVGLTVAALIAVFAPLTQACFNPARDLGPRLWTLLGGWETWAFRANGSGWLTVYVLAPLAGGALGGGLARWFFSRGISSEPPAGSTEFPHTGTRSG